MMITLYDDLLNLERELDETFGAFSSGITAKAEAPAMNVTDSPESLVLTLEVPGVKKDEIKISVQKGVLTISGERKRTTLPEGASWIRAESWTGAFSRSIELPRDVNADAVSAELNNGILRVSLPKLESVRPREIAIR